MEVVDESSEPLYGDDHFQEGQMWVLFLDDERFPVGDAVMASVE